MTEKEPPELAPPPPAILNQSMENDCAKASWAAKAKNAANNVAHRMRRKTQAAKYDFKKLMRASLLCCDGPDEPFQILQPLFKRSVFVCELLDLCVFCLQFFVQ